MDSEKKQNIYKTIMLIVMVAIITFVATTVLMYNKIGGTKYVMLSNQTKDSDLTSKLNTFKKLIDKVYLGDVNEEELEQGAIKGYIEGLGDPYSEYYTKEEMEEVSASTLGNFDGIGIYMTKDVEKNQIIVLAPIEESAAEKAGILPGDIITKVDGVEYKGDEMSLAASKIKGESGTEVELEINRDGEVLNFKIKRENVKINHIGAKILTNNIGYLKISSFDEGCSDEFEEKYNEIKNKGIKSLIIDLRNNGGGIVDEALSIADMVIDKGKTTLITVDKNNKEEIRTAQRDPIISEKIVILVNENTASASEILAGCLKDYEKATIVGTTTYGKGVIQELMSLKDGSGIKLTTNEYLTPNRNKINKEGIEPDIEIKLPEEVTNILSIEEKQDTQLQKAIEILK